MKARSLAFFALSLIIALYCLCGLEIAHATVEYVGTVDGEAVRISDAEANQEQPASAANRTNQAPAATESAGVAQTQIEPDNLKTDQVDLNNQIIQQDNLQVIDTDDTLILPNDDNDPFPANGDWKYSKPVTLIAQSASKYYDGLPLRCPDVFVYGLPDNFNITAETSGSPVVAGSVKNLISSYTIFNQAGQDVTKHFTNINTVAGTLIINPLPITVWTGSASKFYDGEPLTNEEAGFYINTSAMVDNITNDIVDNNTNALVDTNTNISVDINNPSAHTTNLNISSSYRIADNVQKQPWRNLALLLPEKDGNALYCLCGSVYVFAIKPLNNTNDHIYLQAGQKLIFDDSPDNLESKHFAIEDLSVNTLPIEALHLYADNPNLREQFIRDTGWNTNDLAKRIQQYYRLATQPADTSEKLITGELATGGSATENPGVRELATGELAIEELTADDLTKGSSSIDIGETIEMFGLKVSEGLSENLINTGVRARVVPKGQSGLQNNTFIVVKELQEFMTLAVNATGSQTEIGESENTYEIFWGRDYSINFAISEDLGMLVVKAFENPVVITAGSATKSYDGTALTDNSFTVYGLPEGFRVMDVTIDGSQTEVGSSSNIITGFNILDKNGNSALDYFTNIRPVPGTLEVTAPPIIEITVTTGSASKVYDGTPLTDNTASITGLKAEDAGKVTVTATGIITNAGTAQNTYSINWGDVNPESYNIVEEDLGTLEVEKLGLSLNMGSESVGYSGSTYIPDPTLTYLNGSHAGETVTGIRMRSLDVIFAYNLFTEDSMQLTITGIPSDAGTHTFTVSANFGEKESDYSLDIPSDLSITIEPAPLSISTGSASKPYDGTALTSDEANVTGLQGGDSILVTATGTITQIGTTDNTYAIDWGDVNSSNYVITQENLGTLEVTAPLITEISVTTGSDSKTYDGTPLTNSEALIVGLRAEDEGKVTIAATGTITDAGTTQNTYTINWGDVDPNTYSITESLGTLEVEKLALTANIDLAKNRFTYGELSSSLIKDALSFQTTPSMTCNIYDDESSYRVQFSGFILVFGVAQKDSLPNIYTVGDHEIGLQLEMVLEGNQDNLEIRYENSTYNVQPAALTITTGSDTKDYDGTPLTKDEATISGLIESEKDKVTISATGTITDAGTQTNTYTINWGDVDSGNYLITTVNLGELKVTAVAVIFDMDCWDHDFDGYPALPGLEAGISGTYADGSEIEKVSQTNTTDDVSGRYVSVSAVFNLIGNDQVELSSAGVVDVAEEGYTIIPDINMVSGTKDNYIFDFTNNTRMIYPIEVEFSVSDGVDIFYDGCFHGGNLQIISKDEDFFSVELQSSTDGKAVWKVYCANGDIISVTITGGGIQPSDYMLNCTYDFSYCNESNYQISTANTSLTITTWDLTVILASDTASKNYDGSPLTAEGCSITTTEGWLPGTWNLVVTATGSQIEVGSSENTIDYHVYNEYGNEITNAVSVCFTLKPGTLTIIGPEPEKETYDLTLYIDMTYTLLFNEEPYYGDVVIEGAECTLTKASNTYWTVTLPDESSFAVKFLESGEAKPNGETPSYGYAVADVILSDEVAENCTINYGGCYLLMSGDESNNGIIYYTWIGDNGTVTLDGQGIDGCCSFHLLDLPAFMSVFSNYRSSSSTEFISAALSQGIIRKP